MTMTFCTATVAVVVVAVAALAAATRTAEAASVEQVNAWRDECEDWAEYVDTEEKSRLWKLVSAGAGGNVKNWHEAEPCISFARSQDGRGPLFWAYEFGEKTLAKFFIENGASEDDEDSDGKRPVDLAPDDWDDLPEKGFGDITLDDMEAAFEAADMDFDIDSAFAAEDEEEEDDDSEYLNEEL